MSRHRRRILPPPGAATHVNGGFALHAAGVPGTGVVVLAPGEELAATFRVTVEG